MQQGGLYQAGKGLVQAVHNQIRPRLDGALRKIVIKTQMGAMSLVHQYRNSSLVGNLDDRSDITPNSLIGG